MISANVSFWISDAPEASSFDSCAFTSGWVNRSRWFSSESRAHLRAMSHMMKSPLFDTSFSLGADLTGLISLFHPLTCSFTLTCSPCITFLQSNGKVELTNLLSASWLHHTHKCWNFYSHKLHVSFSGTIRCFKGTDTRTVSTKWSSQQIYFVSRLQTASSQAVQAQ